jgi:predicted RNA-binding protein YlqC (UPF0109 family)
MEVLRMKELIKYIAQSLVDNPDKVEVTEVIGEQASVKELTVEQVSLREE